MSQKHLYEGWIILEVPEGWEAQEEPDLITLIKTGHGVGALQFSFYHRNRANKNIETDAKQMVLSFMQQENVSITNIKVNLARFKNHALAFTEYIKEEKKQINFWRLWQLVDATRAVTITYNCDIEDKDIERKEIDEIISKIEFHYKGEFNKGG
jgi:hypothetical protein